MLKIQVMDSGQVSMIQSNISCAIDGAASSTPFTFTLDTSKLDTVVSAANKASYVLSVMPSNNNTAIDFHVRENASSQSDTGFSSKTTVATRVAESSHYFLDMWETTWTTVISLESLKNFIRRAISLGADKLRLSIYTIGDTPSAESESLLLMLDASDAASGSKVTDTFVFSADDATNGAEHVFQEPMLANVDESRLKLKYSEMFSATHLQAFLKTTDRDQVYLKLTDEKPLVCYVDLGNSSSVCLVLASIAEDDDGDA